ncbi:MAG TPA: tetratricopeptide repeat protein [Oculatellaceae cyanobacterium]
MTSSMHNSSPLANALARRTLNRIKQLERQTTGCAEESEEASEVSAEPEAPVAEAAVPVTGATMGLDFKQAASGSLRFSYEKTPGVLVTVGAIAALLWAHTTTENKNNDIEASRRAPQIRAAAVVRTEVKTPVHQQVKPTVAVETKQTTKTFVRPSQQHKVTNSQNSIDVQSTRREAAWSKQLGEANCAKSVALGIQAMKAGGSAHAVAALSRAVQLDPNNVQARRYLAYALANDNQPIEALGQFDAFTQLQTVGINEKIDFANRLANTSDQLPAKELFSQLVEEANGNTRMLTHIASVCEHHGFTSEAASAARSGLKTATPEETVRLRQVYYRALSVDSAPKQPPLGTLSHFR